MSDLLPLLNRNREWAEEILTQDPTFFERLAALQAPEYLWIGCSDSRVPATQLVSLMPGEMFVHRNVANVVVHSDLNCLAVLQYAVEVLQVRHIIVCGHYGCGGVDAALHNRSFGLIDNWLRHVQAVRNKHTSIMERCADDAQRLRVLCELNVVEQVLNVCQTTVLQSAWNRRQKIAVHGWIYGVADGLLREVGMSVSGNDGLDAQYTQALEMIQTSIA
jgi:carbonic anhydrase